VSGVYEWTFLYALIHSIRLREACTFSSGPRYMRCTYAYTTHVARRFCLRTAQMRAKLPALQGLPGGMVEGKRQNINASISKAYIDG